VTEKTVGKHLENIYARLQVSSRTAAVIRAFPDGAARTTLVLGADTNGSLPKRRMPTPPVGITIRGQRTAARSAAIRVHPVMKADDRV
jgi:hypothetical protein